MEIRRFDPLALYRALDEERVRRGLSWSTASREIGVAASTIKRLQTADVFEVDGILWLVQWLGRPVEDYLEPMA
jgi:hypothetical protein